MKLMSIVIAALALVASGMANAFPGLQLDFEGGIYEADPQDLTTYCNTDVGCDLYALLEPDSQKGSQTDTEYQAYINGLLADKYYISMALVPKTGPTDVNLGSFKIDSDTINVTTGMTFGTPPLEGLLASTDPNDLAGHGVFETFFYQLEFMFAATDTINPYNVQDDATVDPTDQIPNPAGTTTGAYYAAFTIDTMLLDPDVELHFDLYNSKITQQGNPDVTEQIGINDFAPFSKDAQSSTSSTSTSSSNGPPGGGIPEPNILALLGASMLGLLVFRRRRGVNAR